MKTLLQKYIEQVREAAWKETQTKWYDSGVRNVYGEGYLAGLEKAQRLVNKQNKISKDFQEPF